MGYRTGDEIKYYGSDYNKFLATQCSKKMTVNNIDVISYKREKRILRIIESKHEIEHMPKSQLEVLRIIANIFNYCNEKQNKFRFEVYILRGNHPYESSTIEDLITKKTYRLNKSELIAFSEFRLRLEDI